MHSHADIESNILILAMSSPRIKTKIVCSKGRSWWSLYIENSNDYIKQNYRSNISVGNTNCLIKVGVGGLFDRSRRGRFV